MADLYSEMRLGKSRGGKFKVDEILGSMDEEDRASLRAALCDSGVQTQRVAHVLTERGWPVSWSAVKNWRVKNA